MDFNIGVRIKQLENLDQFISCSKDRVDSILDYLGWNTEKISESHKEMVNCVCDSHHKIPQNKAAEHVEKCLFSKEGYCKSEKLLSEPNYIPGSTILIDDTTKIQVLNHALSQNPSMRTGWRVGEPNPKTSDRLLSVYSADERLALYKFAVQSTSGPPQVPEFNITESKQEKKEHLSEAELKLMERDAKRRRIKYKTKSVHTSRKTTTEITREIINGQMEAYEDWLRNELSFETSSTNTTSYKREATRSPQYYSKYSYDEERLNGTSSHSHSHRSLSKESSQSKYYTKYDKKHSSHESSPHYKRKREHADEYYTRKHDYDPRDHRKISKESHNFNSNKYIDEYSHEREKHRYHKKDYYEDRHSRKHYEDRREHRRKRSKSSYKYTDDNKYKSEYSDRYYENKYDNKK